MPPCDLECVWRRLDLTLCDVIVFLCYAGLFLCVPDSCSFCDANFLLLTVTRPRFSLDANCDSFPGVLSWKPWRNSCPCVLLILSHDSCTSETLFVTSSGRIYEEEPSVRKPIQTPIENFRYWWIVNRHTFYCPLFCLAHLHLRHLMIVSLSDTPGVMKAWGTWFPWYR